MFSVHSGGDVSYALYCVPRCTFICQQVLRDEGLTTGTYDADLAVANLEVDMIPFESDVVSFEMPGVLRDSVLESDVTSLSFVANGMLRLEAHLGTIKHLVGKGELAKRAWCRAHFSFLSMYPSILIFGLLCIYS